jgi:pimeloyl-[acyl-carrier protein] methyl ester esterase
MNNLSLWCSTHGNLGSKKNMVFLHGWGFHSDVWLPLIPFFEKDYRITLIDLPGHARSINVSWSDESDDLINRIIMHIDDNTILVGWSLGGLVATLVAQKEPQKIKSLILIACNPCFVRRDDWVNAMSLSTFEQFEQALHIDVEQILQQFVGLVCKNDEKVRAINKQLKTHLFECGKPAFSALQKSLSLLKVTDLRSVLQQLSIPVLHVLGKQDVLVPIQLANDIKLLTPTHHINIIDNASHIPFYSQPQLVADEMIHFIDRV